MLTDSFYDVKRYVILSAFHEGLFTCMSQLDISDPSLLRETPQESKTPLYSAPAAAIEPSAEGTDRNAHPAWPHWTAGPVLRIHFIVNSWFWTSSPVRQCFYPYRAAFTLVVCSRSSFVPFLFRGRGENSGRFPKIPQL